MRTKLTIAATFAVALALAVLEGRSRGQQQLGRSSRPMAPVLPVFYALDANGDAILSPAEIKDAPARLKVLDRNVDGRLADEEIRPAFTRGGRPGEFGRRGGEFREPGGRSPGSPDQAGGSAAGASSDELANTLMAFDKNEDGKLTQAEVPERFQGLFDRADANKDGVLTEDELKRAAAAQSGPATGPARDRRTGRGGRGLGRGLLEDPLTAAIDVNRDGAISADEMRNAPMSLGKLDINNDLRLTADEISTAVRPGRDRE